MRFKKFLPLVGFFILVILLFQLDFIQILLIFSDISSLYLFLSFFIFIPLLLLAAVEWKILLKRQKINVSFWYSIKNFFIGYFYGFITPGGIGAYARSLYLSEESGEPLAKCVSNIITFNTIEFLSLLFLGFIGALFLSSLYPYLFVIILFLAIIVIFVYTFFLKTSHSHIFFQKIIKLRLFSGLTKRIQDPLRGFREDVPSFRDVLLPFGLSLLGWLLKYIMLFFIAHFFGISINVFFFILILAVADVIASIPISIYGIGTREVSLITLFSIPQFSSEVMVSAEQIVSLSLFWFVIIWLIPSILGAFVTLNETRKMNRSNLDNKTCTRFEKYMKKYPDLYLSLARIVKPFLKSKSEPYIVDLGVGPGLLDREVNKLVPNATIIGIDPVECMLRQAEKNAVVNTLQGTAERLPIKNNIVDVFVIRYSLSYWSNPQQSFQEMFRVLKPEGVIVAEVLNKHVSRIKLFFIKIHMILNNAGLLVAKYHQDAFKTAYDVDTVLSLFENNGFVIIHTDFRKGDWRFLVIGKKR